MYRFTWESHQVKYLMMNNGYKMGFVYVIYRNEGEKVFERIGKVSKLENCT